MKITIELRGFKEYIAAMRAQPEIMRREMFDTTRRAVMLVQDQARYPPPSRAPMQFKSDKQRRYVMMLVRQGKVPYRRTGTLGRTIGTEVRALGAVTIGAIGTNTVYAPHVIDTKRQARYHTGTWFTLQGLIRKNAGAIKALYEDMIKRVIARLQSRR